MQNVHNSWIRLNFALFVLLHCLFKGFYQGLDIYGRHNDPGVKLSTFALSVVLTEVEDELERVVPTLK